MSFSDGAETDFLELLFTNVTWSPIGSPYLDGSTSAGVFWLSLHTSDPGDAGDQTTNEATYTSYARVSVARDGTEWTVTGNTVTNDNQIQWPACTGGTNTITHFGIGTESSGAGYLIGSGALTASLAVSSGITPTAAASALSCSVT